ncbi:uncharacterized protein LOC112575145 isoform X3 [Pomacea canaliculata]|uniref:uncharacterized protein LOC112575145 isoform X3 n=1 Tax=Pomacea canaliculata TaxID=400727 RepID=UPI000D72CF85|nr:uncharacterized protein LOC112575145 isoform X3 [Pomacea canaliculata]
MMAVRIWRLIVALCVYTDILFFTTAQSEECECEEFPCTTQRRYEYADFSRKLNVALGKPVSSSSVHRGTLSSAQPCVVVSGHVTTHLVSDKDRTGICFLTAAEDKLPYWEVDLLEPYLLAGINITWALTADSSLDYSREGSCRFGFYGTECEGICEQPICWNREICSGVDGSCPPEEPEITVECDSTSFKLACAFDVVVMILAAVAAKVIPKKKDPPMVPLPAATPEVKEDEEEKENEGEREGEEEETTV